MGDISQRLFDQVKVYLPQANVAAIKAAYNYADSMHEGQTRLSGEPYIEHPATIALHLAAMKQDSDTLVAALLHDVVEDCGVTVEDLEFHFGKKIAKLVDGVTKITRLDEQRLTGGLQDRITERRTRIESIRKMLVAMAEDIRVVLIKLGDRLHNMQTLDVLPIDRQKAIAQETLDVYAPLAHRLGIWDFKWQLEDLAFRYVNYPEYAKLAQQINADQPHREYFLERQRQQLSDLLKELGIRAEITGRPKNVYSVYQKQQKYLVEGKQYSDIYDLYGMRVIVESQADCYNALGVIHSLWRPASGQFDDYIANPKQSMYQSLHTTVICDKSIPLEIQIRTHEMHSNAEYGVAAHWSYKEGTTKDMRFEEKMTWIRQLLDWQRDAAGAEEFLDSVTEDIFQDQVFVYTPLGQILEMPVGSTPIDFAYHIHTDLGHRCIGAKINGRLEPLDTSLRSGDTVEIMTSKKARGPSMDWLNPSLGILKTASARQKVRLWFRRQERSSRIGRGKELLVKSIRRLGLSLSEEEIANQLKFEKVEDLLIDLGSGNLSVGQLEFRLTPAEEVPLQIGTPLVHPENLARGIQVLGVGDLMTRTGICCNPLPGEEIIGYITRSRGITVHKIGCSSVVNEEETERLVDVSWGPAHQLHPIRVEITAWDRVGLLRDVTTLVAGEKVNMSSVATDQPGDGTALIKLTVFATGVKQVSRLLAQLEGIEGVLSVSRRD